MEEWLLDFEWLRVQHFVKNHLEKEKTPNLDAILMLVGIQELGRVQHEFSKEEKQDLMHIGTCRLLERDGYYRFVGRDQDGWPHYEELKPFTLSGVDKQEGYLKLKIVEYFKQMYDESE